MLRAKRGFWGSEVGHMKEKDDMRHFRACLRVPHVGMGGRWLESQGLKQDV